ncbi:polysaccharide biosynthesis/export family protein [Phenylobacterium sp.]|jgi:protein involved in polysaccharide export with SLBB domain|uniref:polysaccharide biosynthesis/export family protein n=1 Tax=Phenylobacterium sp. TaxID=1871053 RepID=UPI0037850239
MGLRLIPLAALAFALVAGACTTQEIRVVEREPRGFAAWSDAPPIHRLGMGDRVKFDFPLTPENNEEVVVAPDGYIGVRVAGRLRAQGLSVSELQDLVAERARARLKNPMVVASLSDSRSARVIVGGQVKNPGVYAITARPTVLEAVMIAGGLNPESRMTEVVVLRLRPDNTAMMRKVDLRAFVSRADTTQNIRLEPEDMVFVPRSRIAEVNLWVEEYLNRNIFFGRNIQYTKNQEVD